MLGESPLLTASFQDIRGKDFPKPTYDTRVKMLWDDHYFYVAAYLEEPHIQGTITQRDAVIFHDNDFEVLSTPMATPICITNSK